MCLLALLLLALATPAAAQPKPPSPVSFAPDATSTWISYAENRAGLILFDMDVNGQTLRTLLDTGFTSSAIDRGAARRLGLKTTVRGITVHGLGGTTRMDQSAPASLRAGPLTARGIALLIGDLAPPAATVGRPIEAVLGMDVLRRVALEIDPAQRRFRLVPSRRGAGDLPLGATNRLPWLTLALAGSPPLRLHIDTGADDEIALSPAASARLDPAGLLRTTIASQGVSSIAVDDLVAFPELRLGQSRLEDVLVRTRTGESAISRRGFDGVIGMTLLARFRTRLDFAAGEAALTALPGPPPRAPRSTAGLQTSNDGDQRVVRHVMANSPAASAGWRAGERFCAVEGVPAPEVERNPRSAGWGVGRPGRTISITMCDGSERRLTLARFY